MEEKMLSVEELVQQILKLPTKDLKQLFVMLQDKHDISGTIRLDGYTKEV